MQVVLVPLNWMSTDTVPLNMPELKVDFVQELGDQIFNHRKNLLCPLDFRYYLSSAGCLCIYVCIYVSMYVSAIVATPFNLEL